MQDRKKIILIRSSVNTARIEKEADFLAKDYEVAILLWDRHKERPKTEKKQNYSIYYIKTKGPYGPNLKYIFGTIQWGVLEFFWLLRRRFDVVHACDFDSFLPAFLLVKIKRRKIIYDICDFFAAILQRKSKILAKVVKKIDLFLIQFADGVIIADKNRKKQIRGSCPKRLIAIYNTPKDILEKAPIKQKQTTFTLTYIGLLNEKRGLKLVVDLVKEIPNIKLLIGGEGSFEKELKDLTEDTQDIKFLGRVYPYERALKIMAQSDVLFALYDPKDPNHKFSSPNKLFEAMMLAKPIIVSKNTNMDKTVKQYQCGIVVDYNNKEQLKDALLKLKKMKAGGNNFYGENGRKAYLSVFHPRIMQTRLLKTYQDILRLH